MTRRERTEGFPSKSLIPSMDSRPRRPPLPSAQPDHHNPPPTAADWSHELAAERESDYVGTHVVMQDHSRISGPILEAGSLLWHRTSRTGARRSRLGLRCPGFCGMTALNLKGVGIAACAWRLVLYAEIVVLAT